MNETDEGKDLSIEFIGPPNPAELINDEQYAQLLEDTRNALTGDYEEVAQWIVQRESEAELRGIKPINPHFEALSVALGEVPGGFKSSLYELGRSVQSVQLAAAARFRDAPRDIAVANPGVILDGVIDALLDEDKTRLIVTQLAKAYKASSDIPSDVLVNGTEATLLTLSKARAMNASDGTVVDNQWLQDTEREEELATGVFPPDSFYSFSALSVLAMTRVIEQLREQAADSIPNELMQQSIDSYDDTRIENIIRSVLQHSLAVQTMTVIFSGRGVPAAALSDRQIQLQGIVDLDASYGTLPSVSLPFRDNGEYAEMFEQFKAEVDRGDEFRLNTAQMAINRLNAMNYQAAEGMTDLLQRLPGMRGVRNLSELDPADFIMLQDMLQGLTIDLAERTRDVMSMTTPLAHIGKPEDSAVPLVLIDGQFMRPQYDVIQQARQEMVSRIEAENRSRLKSIHETYFLSISRLKNIDGPDGRSLRDLVLRVEYHDSRGRDFYTDLVSLSAALTAQMTSSDQLNAVANALFRNIDDEKQIVDTVFGGDEQLTRLGNMLEVIIDHTDTLPPEIIKHFDHLYEFIKASFYEHYTPGHMPANFVRSVIDGLATSPGGQSVEEAPVEEDPEQEQVQPSASDDAEAPAAAESGTDEADHEQRKNRITEADLVEYLVDNGDLITFDWTAFQGLPRKPLGSGRVPSPTSETSDSDGLEEEDVAAPDTSDHDSRPADNESKSDVIRDTITQDIEEQMAALPEKTRVRILSEDKLEVERIIALAELSERIGEIDGITVQFGRTTHGRTFAGTTELSSYIAVFTREDMTVAVIENPLLGYASYAVTDDHSGDMTWVESLRDNMRTELLNEVKDFVPSVDARQFTHPPKPRGGSSLSRRQIREGTIEEHVVDIEQDILRRFGIAA